MNAIPIDGYQFIPPSEQSKWLDELLHAMVFERFAPSMLSHRYLVLLTPNGITGPEHSEKIIGIPVTRLRFDQVLNPKEQALAYFWKNGQFGRLIPCPVVVRRFQFAHHLNDMISKSLGYQFNRILTNGFPGIDPYYTGSLVLMLLKHLIFLDTAYRSSKTTANLKITPKQFNMIKQMIDQRMGEKIYTAELADLIGLSEGYFYEAFKDMTGVSPRQYILTLKTERAKELLLESSESVIQVGMSVGFDNPANFSRMFKKFAGVSPTGFKKQYKNRLRND